MLLNMFRRCLIKLAHRYIHVFFIILMFLLEYVIMNDTQKRLHTRSSHEDDDGWNANSFECIYERLIEGSVCANIVKSNTRLVADRETEAISSGWESSSDSQHHQRKRPVAALKLLTLRTLRCPDAIRRSSTNSFIKPIKLPPQKLHSANKS